MKLAAIKKDNQEEPPRNNQVRDRTNFKNQDHHITQVLE